MDLNDEAVDIAKLSLWIKTAVKAGKELTSLDHSSASATASWRTRRFTRGRSTGGPTSRGLRGRGGFDVVIGNPPYVRQEWLSPFKPYWERAFESFNSVADIYVYFYELGVNILRPGGRLGFITSGRLGAGQLRRRPPRLPWRKAAVEEMIDFGEFQPFQDAEMIRPTIAVVAQRPPGGRLKLLKWLTSGLPPENLPEALEKAPTMLTSHLGAEAWSLRPRT